MKTVILLYLFFTIELSVVALIFANFNSEPITISNLQTQRSTTFDEKLESWNISVDKEAKTVNNDYSTPVEKRFGTKEKLYNKKIPTIESELGYQAMQEEKKLREQLRRLNLLTIQKNQNYLQELMNDERGKREFYHPAHLSSSGRNLYPPHLYPNTYDIRNFDNWLMNRKRHPKILSENQDDKLEEIEPLSKQKSAFPMFPNQSGRSEEEFAATYKEESPLSMFPNQYGRSGEETVSPYKERVLLVFPNQYGRSGEKNVLPYKKESPPSMFPNQYGMSEEEVVPSYKEKGVLLVVPNQYGRSREENALSYKRESPLSIFPSQDGRSEEETVPSYKEKSVRIVFPNQHGRSGEENVLPYKEESPPSMFPNPYGMSGEEVVPSYKEKSVLLVVPNQYGRSGEENALTYKIESPLSIFPSQDGRSEEETVPPYKEKSVRIVFPNQYGRSGEENVLPYKEESPPSMFPNQDGSSGEETVPSYKEQSVRIVFPNQYRRSGEENALPYKKESPLSMFRSQDSRLKEETLPSYKEKSILLVFPNQYGTSGEENALPYNEESPLSMFLSQGGRSGEQSVPPYNEESPLSMFPSQDGRSVEENALPYNEQSPPSMFPSQDGRSGEENALPYNEESPLSMFSSQDGRSREENVPPYREERVLSMFPNRDDRSEEETVPPCKKARAFAMFRNQNDRSGEENVPPYKEESAHFSKDTSFISMPTVSNVNEKLPNLLDITTMGANGTAKNSFIKPNEESRIEKGFFKRINLNFQNINQMTSRLNKIVTRSKNSENNQSKKQESPKSNYPKSDKEETLHSHFDFLDFSKTNEKEEKTESPLHTLQLRFERNSTLDDSEDRNMNQLLHNRVYFERMPENTNFSWFVYVNCSRDKCLLTNNTDENELSSEGWILHNCTHYGCIEMYPRNESIRKIIGLILLVFSLCVLKAAVFLLIFYYCRRMKLSKNAPADADSDEEKSIIGEKKSLEKNHENDRNREVITEKFETTSSQQKDIYNSDQDKETNSLVAQEVERDDSKDQHVGLCLINTTPNKNILISKKSFETKAHKKISAIPKCKSYRSSIPRLERWKKCKDNGTAKVEMKKAEHDVKRKTPKRAKATPGGDGDILLMNLDVEEDNSSLCMAVKQDNTPKWSTLLENECKSFVSIDLSDSKF